MRPIKLNDYLPIKPSPLFTGVNRTIGSIDSFSSITKSYKPIFGGQERRTDDRSIFKIPLQPVAPTPVHQRSKTISGSVESISSGYQSDGFPLGMSNIRKWLKSLRLHKYYWVFDGVTYERMFTFTEDYLKELEITQGASHKLAICIEKLKTRCEAIKQVELNLSQNQMYMAEAIYEIESMVLSPMKPLRLNCDTDVGYQLFRMLNLSKFYFRIFLIANQFSKFFTL